MKPALIRGYDNRFALSELWGQAFGDESEFISHMYECGYLKASDVFVLTVDGRLAAALFLPEYRIRVGERDHIIRLLSCVATDPMHRGKGYMSYLISRSLEIVRDLCSGVCVIPMTQSLFSFYEKLGFETAFFIDERTFSSECSEVDAEPSKNLSVEECYSAYAEKYCKDGCVYKTKERFLQAVEEYHHPSQASEFFVCGSQFAFVQRESSRILLREWVGDEEFLKNTLFQRYGLPICVQDFPTQEGKIPFAMLRSFDPDLSERAKRGDLYLNCMYN